MALTRLRFMLTGTHVPPEKQIVLKTEVHRGDQLTLEREPLNEFDPNCIRVLTKANKWIGYVPRHTAAMLAPLLDGPDGNVTVAKVTAVKELMREGAPYLTADVSIVVNPTVTFRIDPSLVNSREEYLVRLKQLKEAARDLSFEEFDRSGSIKKGLTSPETKRRHIVPNMPLLEKLITAMGEYDYTVKEIYQMYCSQVSDPHKPALPTFYAIVRELRTSQKAHP